MANQPENTILTALHYLFSRSTDGRIVAHCLDLDLVTSSDNIAAAEERLNAIVLTQIQTCYASGNFSQLRFKAPAEYWDTLPTAKQLEHAQLEVEVPPVVLPVKRSVVTLAVYRSEMAMAA